MSGTTLVSFLEFWLRELKVRDTFDDLGFLRHAESLSALVDGQPVAPLLVMLYARLLASSASSSVPPRPLSGIPDLLWEYVNRLNRAIVAEGRTDSEVHRALKTVAWMCCAGSYVPRRCSKDAAASAISSDRAYAEAMLDYLESRLFLIETIQPAQHDVRIVLDPLAEYFAADYLLGGGADRDKLLDEFLTFVESDPDKLAICRGFAEALVHTSTHRDGFDVLLQNRLQNLSVALGTVPPDDVAGARAPVSVTPS